MLSQLRFPPSRHRLQPNKSCFPHSIYPFVSFYERAFDKKGHCGTEQQLHKATQDIITDKDGKMEQTIILSHLLVSLPTRLGLPLVFGCIGVSVCVCVCVQWKVEVREAGREEVGMVMASPSLCPFLLPSLSFFLSLFLFSPPHPHQIFNGLHWCHRGISVAKALKGLKSLLC